jgi:Rab-GTPase-TBC domain
MPSISSRREQYILPIPLTRTDRMSPPPRSSRSASNKDVPSSVTSARPETTHRNRSTGCSPTSVQNQQVDRFGFITNMDATGKIQPTMTDISSNSSHGRAGPPEDIAEAMKKTERRERKWSNMVETWDTTNNRRQKLVLNRLRKGLPDSMRGKVWPLLGNVPKKMRPGSSTRGVYKALLQQCEDDNRMTSEMPPEGPNQSTARGPTIMMRSSSFQNIQETIERDIHRTFPRHSLFYDEENHKDDLPPPNPPAKEEKSDDDDDDSQQGLGALCNEDLTTLMRELDVTGSHFEEKKKGGGLQGGSNHNDKSSAKNKKDGAPAKKDAARVSVTCETVVEAQGGQAALRRVLCAYSYYDREVGYCQGMNFIAGMFITIMTEEEAFWMLVGTYQYEQNYHY